MPFSGTVGLSNYKRKKIQDLNSLNKPRSVSVEGGEGGAHAAVLYMHMHMHMCMCMHIRTTQHPCMHMCMHMYVASELPGGRSCM